MAKIPQLNNFCSSFKMFCIKTINRLKSNVIINVVRIRGKNKRYRENSELSCFIALGSTNHSER